MLTYLRYMGLYCPVSLACQALPYDPKSVETHSNVSTTLQAVPKRPQMFSIYLMFMFTYIIYNDIPYGIMLNIPPFTPQKLYLWEGVATFYQVLHVIQLQACSFSRCVCDSYNKEVRILYLSVKFGPI